MYSPCPLLPHFPSLHIHLVHERLDHGLVIGPCLRGFAVELVVFERRCVRVVVDRRGVHVVFGYWKDGVYRLVGICMLRW
jgi:hypothetical protein